MNKNIGFYRILGYPILGQSHIYLAGGVKYDQSDDLSFFVFFRWVDSFLLDGDVRGHVVGRKSIGYNL